MSETQQNILFDFFDFEGYQISKSTFESKLQSNTFNPHCPVCLKQVLASDYLHDIFIVEKNNYFAYYMAVFVTHYRHNHQISWNKLHSNYAYQQAVPKYDYDQKKIEYNNRGKRQLIRAIVRSENYSLEIKVQLIAATDYLQYNDIKTKELMNKSILKILDKGAN